MNPEAAATFIYANGRVSSDNQPSEGDTCHASFAEFSSVFENETDFDD